MTIRRTISDAHLRELSVDPKFQRPLNHPRVSKEAANFDVNGLGTITISLRADGTKVILDGQHRAAICREAGYKNKLKCVQFEGLNPEEEASLFLVLNNSKQVQAIDKFRARVAAAEPDAVQMNEILSAYGWRVQASKHDFNFAAVVNFEKVYRGAGVMPPGEYPALARLVMFMITSAWGGQVNSAHNLIVLSLGKVLAWHAAEVDDTKLALELSKIKPMNFVSDAKATAGAMHIDQGDAGATVLIRLHNKGRRTRVLPEWRV